MAEKKQEEQTVTPPPADSGVGERQVKPIAERSREEQAADLVHPEDIKHGVLKEPEHEADQSPYPNQQQPPQERPPFSTGRPDVPIVQSAVTGAGAHTPPDPEAFTPDGRPRDLTQVVDDQDRRERDLLMSFAPTPGEDVLAERLAILPSLEIEHLQVRVARERLASDAEWGDEQVLVRIIDEHRRGTITLFPGALVDLRDDEAMVLMQDGVAIPATRNDIAKEIR